MGYCISYISNLFSEKSREDEEDSDIAKILTPSENAMYRWLTKEHCSICLDELEMTKKQLTWLQWFRNENMSIIVMTCSHKFHKNCISMWFDFSHDNTCPICRKRVKEALF